MAARHGICAGLLWNFNYTYIRSDSIIGAGLITDSIVTSNAPRNSFLFALACKQHGISYAKRFSTFTRPLPFHRNDPSWEYPVRGNFLFVFFFCLACIIPRDFRHGNRPRITLLIIKKTSLQGCKLQLSLASYPLRVIKVLW